MSELNEKVQASIQRMKAFEPPEGYLLAFSGGKDSVVLKTLADMAGVKYTAHYNVTSVDPPELVRFIREKYQDVAWEYPRYNDGKRITMWNLIPRKFLPPTRVVRYCCSNLKEFFGVGRYTLTGVRWAESSRRAASHGLLTIPNARPKTTPDGFERPKRGGIILNNDNDDARRVLETCYAKQKKMVNPIVDWEDSDIWEFIKAENVPYCGLYDCDKAVVIAIENLDGTAPGIVSVASKRDRNFIYTVGETVSVPDFCEDRFQEYTAGIHFFINRQEAVEYSC